MFGNHFTYSHWLRFNPHNLKQWEALKNYKEKYECDMSLFYYDYMPNGDKIIKINCNQSHDEFTLDIDLNSSDNFKKLKCKPTNCTQYNKGIYYFFEKYLGIKEEDIKEVSKRNNYNTKEFLPVDVLDEFGDMKNIDFFYNLMKRENWQMIKIKRNRNYLYQLYFGKGKQVDNRYEYCYAQFQGKGRFEERLAMFINSKKKEEEVNLKKFVGRKLNTFQARYVLPDGEVIHTDIKCIGLVLGVSNNQVDLYDYKQPLGEQFYTIKKEDFLKNVYDGTYKVNRNLLNWYEKMEVRKYQKIKLEQIVSLYNNLEKLTENNQTLKSIDIKCNSIIITYQKYSSKLKKHISCNIIKDNNKSMINQFSLLDLYNKKDAYDYMKKLLTNINSQKVKELLEVEEQKHLLEKERVLEEEIDYER